MTCWYPWFLCDTEASYVTSCFIRGVRFYTTHIVDVSNNCHISPHNSYVWVIAAQKMKFSVKDFFSKCDQIRGLLRIWSHLLKISLMENFIFCSVNKILIALKCPALVKFCNFFLTVLIKKFQNILNNSSTWALRIGYCRKIKIWSCFKCIYKDSMGYFSLKCDN